MGEPTIHLCTAADVGMAETCMCCGGWVHAEGNTVPIPGSSPTLQYCSQDCHDDWEDALFAAALSNERRGRWVTNHG